MSPRQDRLPPPVVARSHRRLASHSMIGSRSLQDHDASRVRASPAVPPAALFSAGCGKYAAALARSSARTTWGRQRQSQLPRPVRTPARELYDAIHKASPEPRRARGPWTRTPPTTACWRPRASMLAVGAMAADGSSCSSALTAACCSSAPTDGSSCGRTKPTGAGRASSPYLAAACTHARTPRPTRAARRRGARPHARVERGGMPVALCYRRRARSATHHKLASFLHGRWIVLRSIGLACARFGVGFFLRRSGRARSPWSEDGGVRS